MNDEVQNLATFGQEFQEAIIGYCMKDLTFLINCRAMVEPEWFSHLIYVDLMKFIYELYDFKKTGRSEERVPTPAEVVTKISLTYPKPSDRLPRQETFARCIAAAKRSDISLAWMQEQMTGWIRMIKLKNLIEESNQRFKKKAFGSCIEWVDKRIAEVKQASFIDDMRESFANPVGFITDYDKEQEQYCCTFGHVAIDDVLRPGSRLNFNSYDAREDVEKMIRDGSVSKMTKGSLRPGDLTVIIGATNTGKTTLVVTIAAYNVLMGKYVFLMSHEQDAKQLKMKVLTCMMQMTAQELCRRGPVDPEYQRKLNSLSEVLEKYLCYIHYAKAGGMFVEDVIALFERYNEDLTAKRLASEGVARGFDLVIDDYPAKLKSKIMLKSQGWEEKTYVYNEFLNLAQTHQFHVIAPAQSNRQGFRVSRGDTDNGRMLEVDDIGEAFGITTIAANVITINRSATDVSQSLIRFYVAKCRSPGKGTQFILPVRFDVSRTFDIAGKIRTVPPGQSVSPQELISYFGVRNTAPEQLALSPAPQALQEDNLFGVSNYEDSPEDLSDIYEPVIS